MVKSPRWSPDGRSIAYLARGATAVDVQTIDVATGHVTALTKTAVTEVAPVWSRDGRRVLFGAPSRDGSWHVWSVGPEAPPEVVLSNAVAAQPSPDGVWLYFTRPDQRGVWRVATGASRPAERVIDDLDAASTESWLVAPGGVYYAVDQQDGVRLRRVPLAGGAFDEVAQLPQLSWPGFSIGPDGVDVLYARWDRRESNIMSIEY
jgi:Tol biopolymer transport system component